MLTRVDQRLRQEAREFELRSSCEFCLHFDPERRVCSHGFPAEPHLEPDLEQLSEVSFCKLFELG